jgi:hypothetical protein
VIKWIVYLAVFPTLRASGDESTADALFVQAFGRNSISDANLHEVGRTYLFYGSDHAALEALRMDGVDPGDPNRELALIAMNIMDRNPKLIGAVQWEVALAFPLAWYLKERDRIFCIWPPADPKARFSTRDVKLSSAEILRTHNGKRVIELAHARQIGRAALVVRKIMGEMPVIPHRLVWSFDARSVQPWTRNLSAYLWYESRARVHHLLYRWV